MDDNTDLNMYLDFRATVDKYCFPLLKKWAGKNFREIKYDDKVVGFLMVIDRYVEGIYVMPEYRRQGLAKKAVQDYIRSGGIIEKLHIIKTNDVAKKFWKNLFILKEIDSCPSDSLYFVERLRKRLKDDKPKESSNKKNKEKAQTIKPVPFLIEMLMRRQSWACLI